MIKTFLALAVELGWISTTSTTYAIWSAAGNAAFYFLPVLVGITASLKLGANPYVGGDDRRGAAARGLHRRSALWARETTFLGLPVVVIDYGQSVFPALIAAILLSIMEPALRRRLPRSLHLVLIPTICLAVLVPATAILFGPVGTYVSEALSAAIGWLWQLSPAVAGAIMGGLWQVFVIFGVHWGFVPVIVNDLSVQGHSLLTGPLVAAVLAQGAATLAVMFRTRNDEMRALSGAAAVSAFVAGVTEPAIYGVTLRLRRPFIYACIGGMVGGAIAAAGGSAADSFVFPGLITLPAYMHVGQLHLPALGHRHCSRDRVRADPGAGIRGRACPGTCGRRARARRSPTVRCPGPPVLPPLTHRPGSHCHGTRSPAVASSLSVASPLSGEVVALSEVPDPVFARGLLGKGVAIRPDERCGPLPRRGDRHVPCPSPARSRDHDPRMAWTILVHVGIDTVHLGRQALRRRWSPRASTCGSGPR